MFLYYRRGDNRRLTLASPPQHFYTVTNLPNKQHDWNLQDIAGGTTEENDIESERDYALLG